MSLIFTVLLSYGSVVTLRYKTVTRGGLVDGLLLASITANFGFEQLGVFCVYVCVCLISSIKRRQTLNMSVPDGHLAVAQSIICAGVPEHLKVMVNA